MNVSATLHHSNNDFMALIIGIEAGLRNMKLFTWSITRMRVCEYESVTNYAHSSPEVLSLSPSAIPEIFAAFDGLLKVPTETPEQWWELTVSKVE